MGALCNEGRLIRDPFLSAMKCERMLLSSSFSELECPTHCSPEAHSKILC